MQKLLWTIAMVVVLGAFIVALVISPPTPKHVPLYSIGDIVCSVISGQKGQILVVRERTSNDYYDVRFVASQIDASTSFLGGDAPVQQIPLARIDWMREYELTECSN